MPPVVDATRPRVAGSIELAPRQAAGLCGQVCRFLTMRHTIEDQSMLPAVAAPERYAPVTARLVEAVADLRPEPRLARRLRGGRDGRAAGPAGAGHPGGRA